MVLLRLLRLPGALCIIHRVSHGSDWHANGGNQVTTCSCRMDSRASAIKFTEYASQHHSLGLSCYDANALAVCLATKPDLAPAHLLPGYVPPAAARSQGACPKSPSHSSTRAQQTTLQPPACPSGHSRQHKACSWHRRPSAYPAQANTCGGMFPAGIPHDAGLQSNL